MAAAAWQHAEVEAVVAAVTTEQQRDAEAARPRAQLAAEVPPLSDHDVDIRRLFARIYL